MIELINKRERYTVTDTGPIADDWQDAYLQEVSSFVSNGFVGSSIKHYTEEPDGIPYVQGYNLKNGEIDPSKMYKITRAFNDAQKKTQLKTGDILTVQSGHIGETAVVPKALEGANCHALIISRFKQEKVCPYFMAQYLNSHIGRSRMRGLEVGSTILHINTKDFKKFRLPLPPLSEQKKIVEILKTWDEAIRLTESLIAKKQRHKKALIYNLITNTKSTKKYIVSDLFKLGRGRVISKKEIEENAGDYPVYSSQSQNNGEMGRMNSFDFEGDYITWTTDGANAGTVFCRSGKFNCTNVCGTAKPIHEEQVDLRYAALLLQTVSKKYVSYVGNPKLMNGVFGSIEIHLPSYSYQIKVGKIFEAADQEIHLLQTKLSTLRAQKRGLMQQLLTGKRRVHV